MTLTDTGPLISLIDSADTDHFRCLTALPSLTLPLITTWPCYTETMYFLGKSGGFRFQQALWRMRRDKRLLLHEVTEAEADRMEELMMRYQDIPMDIADASLVAAAETVSVKRVFTLDSHFYAYRMTDGKAFEVVP